MLKDETYDRMLVEDMGDFIESLNLHEVQKNALRLRWLDQVNWLGLRARQARTRYYFLRMTTLVSGVLVPALVSLTLTGIGAEVVRWLTFILSLAVALSTATEQFFNYGDRWRNYRRRAEMLKIEGWQFFQLSGYYRKFDSHAQAYHRFASRVEEIVQEDVQVYLTELVSEKEAKEAKPEEPQPGG